MHHKKSGIAQGECSSSMMADLFLYHYEKNFTTNNNIHLHKYIDDIIIFSANHSKCLFPVKYPPYLNLTKSILKNSYQLGENINKLKNITSIVTYDFKDLFNNINLQDLNKVLNSLFQD